MRKPVFYQWIIFFCILFTHSAFADNQIINLIVGNKTVNFAHKPITAIAINNQIPGPTLHFKEGDQVTIRVFNYLNEETAIHWHGLLVPWQMDGVKGISQQGIAPGKSFDYQFTPHQAGTYWYHSHAGLQEQQGLYGAIIIEPKTPPAYHYDKDFVIVLSDWSNTPPNQIIENLNKDGGYYSSRFPLQASLSDFIHDYSKASPEQKKALLNDYHMMQTMRMGLYDFNDVAYDAFLLNGQPNQDPWRGLVNVGDIVRLRFIGAGASTIFHVKLPGNVMQLVHVQGNDIKPLSIKDFYISPGETYDVLVKIENTTPHMIYAESLDKLGVAYGALVTSSDQNVNYQTITPFPKPLPVTQQMMSMMMSGNLQPAPDSTNKHEMHHESMAQTETNSMHAMQNMNMPMKMDTAKQKPTAFTSNMHTMQMQNMPTEPSQINDILLPPTDSYDTSADIKYADYIAAVPTNDPQKPVYKTINMELFGYMDRYIWFINGIPEHLAKPIVIEPNKRYRFVFTNASMMHHPMHFHGHWFILRKENNAYDPLLHTIDVPPGATITADVDTDASGQWIFHCHLLYHMTKGMTRIFQYSTLLELTEQQIPPEDIIKNTSYYNRPIVRVDEARPLDTALVMHPMPHHRSFGFSNFLKLGEDVYHDVQKFTFKGLYGYEYNKIELFVNDAEIDEGTLTDADLDIFYYRVINQFWALKGGANYFMRPSQSNYWEPGLGIEGLMPYFIDTNLRGYLHSGAARFDIEFSRDTQITRQFYIDLGIRGIVATKTVESAEIGSGVNRVQYTFRPNFRIKPGVDFFAQYEFEKYYGVFRNLQAADGNSGVQNTVTVGFAFLF